MEKLTFLFGNHNHQPVGNFDSVFEEAMDRSYIPFLNLLQEFPDLRMSLHFSGCLLDWVENHRPEFLDDVKQLVDRNQVEILSSGYYEPVLSAIPKWDRMRQLKKMNHYIESRFGTTPAGAWMTERVWESHIVDSLVEADLQYVVIDDYHFKCAGLNQEQIRGYYNTENNGRPLAVFPIRESLRYTIPFADPGKTIQELRSLYDKGQRLVVMLDDGEKFGMWPGTHKLSYKENWVRRFFQALLNEKEWLELATPKEALKKIKPTGMVYLPSASYFEMSEWTLPGEQSQEFSEIVHELEDSGEIERYRPFLRGGIWRNFFMKYPEANNMHKRMLDISKRLRHVEENASESQELKQARQHLLTSQCNCAYWHGVFGGLYLPHLRDAVYRELIAADTKLASLENTGALETRDINLDGAEEPVLRSKELTALITPAYGGSLFELDVNSKGLNLVNTLASRKEGYHVKIQKEQSSSSNGGDGTASIHDVQRGASDAMRKELVYDWHNRYSFLDHFLPMDSSLEKQRDRTFSELGDFVNQGYELSVKNEETVLVRNGHLHIDGNKLPLTVEKRYLLKGSILTVSYKITNIAETGITCQFAPEINFSLLGGSDTEISYYSNSWSKQKMTSAGERPAVEEFGIDDKRKGLNIRLGTSRPARFWYFPSRTVSQSEQGFELNYQSSVVMPVYPLELPSGAEFSTIITMEIKTL